MRGAGQEQRGYSLLELTLVIVLLGVVAFVAVPRFFHRSGYELTGYYHRFVAALDYGRAVAVATSCPVQVRVGAGGFALKQPGGSASGNTLCPTGGYTRAVSNPATGGAFAAAVPSGAAFTAGTGDFCFGGNGRLLASCSQPDGPAAAGDRTITLALGSGGASLSVTVYASTGYAQRG